MKTIRKKTVHAAIALVIVLSGSIFTGTVQAQNGTADNEPNALPAGRPMVRRQPVQTGIWPISQQGTSQAGIRLAGLIENIGKLEIPQIHQAPQNEPSAAAAEPNQTAAVSADNKSKPEKTQTAQPPAGQAGRPGQDKTPLSSPDVITLIAGSENIVNAFELAESLFAVNRLAEAAKYYQLALKQLKEDDHENRQWSIFQTANCLRNDNPQLASEFYARLVAEYPESDWAVLANLNRQLLNWYIQNQPEKLPENGASVPNSR